MEVDEEVSVSLAQKAAPSSFEPQAQSTMLNAIPSKLGNFELITEETLEFADVKIAKWRSKETGLKVVWADVEEIGRAHV